MFQHEHAQDDLRGRPAAAAAPALRVPALQRHGNHLDERLVIDQLINAAQRLGPQLVGVGQHDFPHTPFALSASDHTTSAASSDLAPPARLRPHLGTIAVGQLARDRLKAMPRVHAGANRVHHGVRHVLAARPPVAGPMGQLHCRVLLATGTPTRRLAADPSPLSQRPEHHRAHQALQLFPQRGVRDRFEVIQ